MTMKPPRIWIERTVHVNEKQWREVPGTDQRYWVNREGQIWSTESKKCLRPQSSEITTPTVRLRGTDGNYRTVGIARLVSRLFIGELKPGFHLKFKDHDSHNFRLSNLEHVPTKRELYRRAKKKKKT